ncbi:MAG: hypothetical protein SFY69_04055 [Planctomycetota bacterium]|nr:hypothetical protein [Planctomycetota bacterium]
MTRAGDNPSSDPGPFQWPPRPAQANHARGVEPHDVDGEARGGGDAARGSGDDGRDLSAATHAARGADAVRDQPGRRAGRGSGSSLDVDTGAGRTAWQQIEGALLGLTRPPLVVRAREAGWMPDEAGAFCPRCAASVGAFEGDETGCPACRGVKVPWERAVRLGVYEGVLRDIIHDVKFSAWRALGEELGALMGSAVCAAADRAGVERGRFVVTPVPTTLWRRLSRGVDHTGALARGVAGVVGAPVVRVLDRRHRPAQTRVPASRREANVRGTMRVRRADLGGSLVVLVDDVRTTGATLREACRAVWDMPRESRPEGIWVATAAVAEGEQWRRKGR